MSEILRILGHEPLQLEAGVRAIRFSDRQKCEITLFNELMNIIEKGEKVMLVFENQDEIQNINYLFSKYGLANKKLVLLQNTMQDHPGNVLFQASKTQDAADGKSVKRLAKEIEGDVNTIESLISKLRKEKFGNKTLVEIIDLATKSKFHDFETPSTILSPPFSYDKYVLKKNLYDQAESLYDVSFINLDKINPFSDSFLKEQEVGSCLAMLKDDLQEVEDLLTKFEHKEMQARKQLNAKEQKIESELNSKIEQIRDMVSQLPWSETDIEKMIFHQTELFRLLNITRNLPTRKEEIYHAQEQIEKVFSSRQADLFHINEKKLYDHLKSLTIFNSDSEDTSNLIKRSRALIDRINTKDIYGQQVCGTSVAFFYQHTNLQAIKNSITASIEFMESNKDYLLWKQFETQLDAGDVKMISHLSQGGSFWAQSYEEIFLSYFLSNQRTAISSLSQYMDKLDYNIQELDDEALAHVVRSGDNSAITTDLLKYESWITLLGEASQGLIQAFPVIMIEQSVYRTHGSALMGNIEKIYYLNDLPQKSSTEDWIQDISFGYSADFHHQCKEHPSAVIEVPNNFFAIDKKLSLLNSTELRAASKFLSQEICRYNKAYRIYQTKNCSIVTFLSDTKNSSILMPMLDSGIKEIISNKTGVDLLAGLISDTEKHILILVEDGLFSYEKAIVPQLKLRTSLKDAGVQVISIDNVEMIHNRDEIMKETIEKILEYDRSEMVHAS